MLMMKDTKQRQISLQELVEIQLNSIPIGVIERDQQKVNIAFWKEGIIEVYCRIRHQQWTPFLINYKEQTTGYKKEPNQQITNNHGAN